MAKKKKIANEFTEYSDNEFDFKVEHVFNNKTYLNQESNELQSLKLVIGYDSFSEPLDIKKFSEFFQHFSKEAVSPVELVNYAAHWVSRKVASDNVKVTGYFVDGDCETKIEAIQFDEIAEFVDDLFGDDDGYDDDEEEGEYDWGGEFYDEEEEDSSPLTLLNKPNENDKKNTKTKKKKK